MSECKTVTLRTRPLKKGMLSFYLDYYPGYRDQETMKTIRHEGLPFFIDKKTLAKYIFHNRHPIIPHITFVYFIVSKILGRYA